MRTPLTRASSVHPSLRPPIFHLISASRLGLGWLLGVVHLIRLHNCDVCLKLDPGRSIRIPTATSVKGSSGWRLYVMQLIDSRSQVWTFPSPSCDFHSSIHPAHPIYPLIHRLQSSPSRHRGRLSIHPSTMLSTVWGTVVWTNILLTTLRVLTNKSWSPGDHSASSQRHARLSPECSSLSPELIYTVASSSIFAWSWL